MFDTHDTAKFIHHSKMKHKLDLNDFIQNFFKTIDCFFPT